MQSLITDTSLASYILETFSPITFNLYKPADELDNFYQLDNFYHYIDEENLIPLRNQSMYWNPSLLDLQVIELTTNGI